jgi:hypothetical protein
MVALLLIIASWLLFVWLVLALCRAARLGDLQRREGQLAEPSGEPQGPVAPQASGPTSRAAGRPSNPIVQAGRATG